MVEGAMTELWMYGVGSVATKVTDALSVLVVSLAGSTMLYEHSLLHLLQMVQSCCVALPIALPIQGVARAR